VPTPKVEQAGSADIDAAEAGCRMPRGMDLTAEKAKVQRGRSREVEEK